MSLSRQLANATTNASGLTTYTTALLSGRDVTVVVAVTVTWTVDTRTWLVVGHRYVSVMPVPETVTAPVQSAGSLVQSSRAAIAGA